MKKSLLILGLAAAFASCSNEETTNVAPQRAINFQSFVNNNTKAVTPVTTATDFFVFGNAADTKEPLVFNTQLFNNESDKAVYFWQENKTYRFGGYKDGEANAQIAKNVAFDASKKQLTFTDYTVNDAKDLIAATAETTTTSTEHAAVAMSFKHMLSQVKFTFNSTIGNETQTIKISNLKINGVKMATGTLTDQVIAWTSAKEAEAYLYTLETVFSKTEATGTTDASFVIPQTISVEFDATLNSGTTVTTHFTASNITIEAGFVYNLTAQINPENILNPDGTNHQITFTPTVEKWQDKATVMNPAGNKVIK